jgi:hypothetical protein
MKTYELAVVAFAAMVGGALANFGLAQIVKPAQAQDTPKDSTSDLVRTRRIELVDAEKRTRVLLDAAKGEPVFAMSDNEGNPRLTAQVFSTGEAVLSLKGADGKTRLSLITDADGTPTISLDDAKGNTRATLATAKNGEPRFAILDDKGKAGALLRLKGLSPQLEMYDRAGVVRAALATQDNDVTRPRRRPATGARRAFGRNATDGPLPQGRRVEGPLPHRRRGQSATFGGRRQRQGGRDTGVGSIGRAGLDIRRRGRKCPCSAEH